MCSPLLDFVTTGPPFRFLNCLGGVYPPRTVEVVVAGKPGRYRGKSSGWLTSTKSDSVPCDSGFDALRATTLASVNAAGLAAPDVGIDVSPLMSKAVEVTVPTAGFGFLANEGANSSFR